MKALAVVITTLLPVISLYAAQAPAAPVVTAGGMGQEQRLQLLERKVKALSAQVIRLDTLQRELQQLRGEIEVQNHAMDALKKRQRDLYLDVDQRLSQVSTTAPADTQLNSKVTPSVASPSAVGQAPAPAAAPTPAPVTVVKPVRTMPAMTPPPKVTSGTSASADPAGEKGEYSSAFNMLMQRRYDDAGRAFSDFLAKYPGGDYADNAQYWLAEASYVTRNFDKALEEFQKVLQLYPASSKVPDAMLKSGFILYEKKQWPEARSVLQDLVKRYPGTSANRLAAKRLERMSSEGN
ncbi:MAG: tol-pal system protein YbgF [Candidatus Sedimenticola sp. (ex Thyasira tokunagai)]